MGSKVDTLGCHDRDSVPEEVERVKLEAGRPFNRIWW